MSLAFDHWYNQSTHDIGAISRDAIIQKVGNGLNTSFRKDKWIDDSPLMVWFPRLFILETDKDCCINQI